MKRMMVFKQEYYDAQPIGGKTSISFFQETEENHTSVTGLSEDQALKWLLGHHTFRNMFISDFFENASRIKSYFGVTEPFTEQNKKPGDIDLILVNPEHPNKAIAFECKRIKVTSIDEENSKINNAEKIKHGVIQANKLQSLGFHLSYLLIILLEDGRLYKTPNIMFRHAKTSTIGHIYDMPWNEPLNEDVGIIFIRVNQTTGKHINLGGGLGFCIDRLAKPLEQTVQLTNKIKQFIKVSK